MATGRHSDDEIEITPEMIEAGCQELVFDAELIRSEVAKRILFAALVEGGYRPFMVEFQSR